MTEELTVINSGTTFLRTGGELKIKVRSNVTWQFYLYEVAEDTDIENIQSGMTIEGETEYYVVDGIDTGKTPTWLHVLNEFGGLDTGTTGENTEYLTIVADENLEKKDLYAVGVVKSEANPELGDFTVFLSYGKPSYKIVFEDDVEGTDYGVQTPNTILYSETGFTYQYIPEGSTTPSYQIGPIPSSNYDYTVIPFNIYTTTPCTLTMDGAPQEYQVPTGVSKNDINATTDESQLEYYFKVPTNKDIQPIEYNIKAVSREDDTIVEFYKIILKVEKPKIILSPSSISLQSDDKQFGVQYQGIPSSIIFNIDVYETNTNSLVSILSSERIHTLPSCNGEGTMTYQLNENETFVDRNFRVVATIIGVSEEEYNDGAYIRNPEFVVVGQGGATPPGINISVPITNISSTDSSFEIRYEGTPNTLLFTIYVWEYGESGPKNIQSQTVAGAGSTSYVCGVNTDSGQRTFGVSAATIDESAIAGPYQVTQGGGSTTRGVSIYFEDPLIANIQNTNDTPRDVTITFTLNDGSYGSFSTTYEGYGLNDGSGSLDGGATNYFFQTDELNEFDFGINASIFNAPGSTGYWIIGDSKGNLESGQGGFYIGGSNEIVTRIVVPAGTPGTTVTVRVKPTADINFSLS